jgi:integrase/recombinase XerC/integrase/recombinase XerD
MGELGERDGQCAAGRAAVRATWWCAQGWIAGDPTRRIRRRRRTADRTRALDRADIETLLGRPHLPLREHTLWRLLYETAARAQEVLALDVPDPDWPNRRSKVRRKGGANDIIVWRTATARLLPRLLEERRSGPVFLTERRARIDLPTERCRPGV